MFLFYKWFQLLRSVVLEVWFPGSAESQRPRTIRNANPHVHPHLVNKKFWTWKPKTRCFNKRSMWVCCMQILRTTALEEWKYFRMLNIICIHTKRSHVLKPYSLLFSNNLFFSFIFFTLICIYVCLHIWLLICLSFPLHFLRAATMNVSLTTVWLQYV